MEAVQELKAERFLDRSKEVDLSRFELLKDLTVSGREVAKELRKLRTPQAMSSLKDRVRSHARVFSKNYQIRVLPSSSGTWGVALKPEAVQAVSELQSGQRRTLRDLPPDTFKPTALLYNMNDIALADEEQVMSRLRHEAQHIQSTDYRYIFEGQLAAVQKECLPSTFGLVQMACEDTRVNHQQCLDSKAAKERVAQGLSGRLGEIEAKINEQPLPRQLALNLLYGRWLSDQNLSSLRNHTVIELSEKLSPAIALYTGGVDNDQNFDLLLDQILPALKEAEAAGLQEEMLRIAACDIADQEKRDAAVRRHFLRRISHGISSSRMIRALRRLLRGNQSNSTYDGALSQSLDRAGGPSARKAVSQAVEVQRLAFDERDEGLKAAGKEVGRLRNAVDLTTFPEELKSVLEETCKALPAAFNAELRQRAVASMSEAQSTALAQELPVGLEFRKNEEDPQKQQLSISEVPPAEEIDDVWNSLRDPEPVQPPEPPKDPALPLKAERENAAKLSAELRRREVVKNGFTEQEEGVYRSFKALELSVIAGLEDFLEQLKPYLPKKRGYRQGNELFITGNRVDGRSLAKKIPVRDYRIYTRREPADMPDPCIFVELLIDNSRSMEGEKMEESVKTAIFWARALEEMGIPFAIKFLGERVTPIKGFSQRYDDPVARIKPTLLYSATASEEATDIGSALQAADSEMVMYRRRYPDLFGAVFVISDSGANTGMINEELQQYIRKMQQHFIVMNFILASDPELIGLAQLYFGRKNVVAPAQFRDLPRESIRVLSAVLREAFRRNMGIRS